MEKEDKRGSMSGITRRDVLKLSLAGGVTLAVGGAAKTALAAVNRSSDRNCNDDIDPYLAENLFCI